MSPRRGRFFSLENMVAPQNNLRPFSLENNYVHGEELKLPKGEI